MLKSLLTLKQHAKSLASTLMILLLSEPLLARAADTVVTCAGSQTTQINGLCPDYVVGKETLHETAGVLIRCSIPNSVAPNVFSCYVSSLLSQNMPYVLLIAVVLVVVSGVQYMMAMGAAAEQTKAKQRIVGLLSGVIFYVLIRYLVPLLAGGFTI